MLLPLNSCALLTARFITKLGSVVDLLEKKQGEVNEVYASGAVEGYTDE